MRIFITGANGSLGTELLSRLASRGYEITALALDQNDATNIKNFNAVKIAYGNICHLNEDFLKKYLSETDVFIHLAALVHQPGAPKELFFQVNYEATKKLRDAFEKYSSSAIRQFIFISTVAVYGHHQSVPYDEKSGCQPDTPYAESKWKAEQYLTSRPLDPSLKYTILRPATIYGGPNDKGNIPRLIGLLRKWRIFPLFDAGQAKKSFVHVGDVAQGIISCINNPAAFGQTFNLSAPPLALAEIIRAISQNQGFFILTIKLPALLLKAVRPRTTLCHNYSYSYQKASQAFKYMPKTFPAGL